jgi:hypothetical protein
MVQSRLAELQSEAAANAEVTLQSILKELDQAIAVAKSKSQAQAMVSASGLKAKLSGLLTERIEIGKPGAFDGCTSMAAIADEVLERLIEQFRPIDERDRQGLIEMYQRHLKEAEEYVAAINARPIIASRVDPLNLSTPWTEHQPYAPQSPARIGYRGNGGVSK